MTSVLLKKVYMGVHCRILFFVCCNLRRRNLFKKNRLLTSLLQIEKEITSKMQIVSYPIGPFYADPNQMGYWVILLQKIMLLKTGLFRMMVLQIIHMYQHILLLLKAILMLMNSRRCLATMLSSMLKFCFEQI